MSVAALVSTRSAPGRLRFLLLMKKAEYFQPKNQFVFNFDAINIYFYYKLSYFCLPLCTCWAILKAVNLRFDFSFHICRSRYRTMPKPDTKILYPTGIKEISEFLSTDDLVRRLKVSKPRFDSVVIRLLFFVTRSYCFAGLRSSLSEFEPG